MKRLFISIVCLLECIQLSAGPVDVSSARQVALQFIEARHHNDSESKTRASSEAPLELAYTQNGEVGNVFYVFNQSQDQGFVIVSADDRSAPILGYADKGSFEINNIPVGLKDLLKSYEKQISYAVKNNIGQSRAVSKDRKEREPMIQTKWNQRAPYNNLCPIDSWTKERSITGCGATAIAQLLYYHRYPNVGRNSISYEWNGQTFSADFSQVHFQWDKMNLTYDDNPDIDNAVATLMYYCALSMKSEFTSDNTNSWFDTEFLSTYFGYNDDIKLLWKKDTSDDEFEDAIYNDLLKGLPVYCWAEASNDNDWSHIFLIDGCNKDGLFHMNFGWGGSDDGYYTLTPIDIGWKNMDIFQCILYNIQPVIPGKWFLQTNDGRCFEMSSVGSIEADPNSETDLLLYDISGNIAASGFTEATFIQTGGVSPLNASKGDANGDGIINVIDIVIVADYIKGRHPILFIYDAADVTGDGNVNDDDINGIVKIIMAKKS